MNDERLEQLLKQALIPEIKEDDLKMKRKTENSSVTHKTVPRGTIKNRRHLPAAVAVAALLIASSVTVFAAWNYLSARDVAMANADEQLASHFEQSNWLSEYETQRCGDYDITLLGVVSGNEISEHLSKDDQGKVDGDKTYIAVAIAYADGKPMPDVQSDNFERTQFFVSPYIHGFNPEKYNAYTLSGGVTCFVSDGIQYRLVETDNVEYFADCGIYVGVSDGDMYNNQAYIYDTDTGEILRSETYQGVNALFDLPVNTAKADSVKASGIIADINDSESNGGYLWILSEGDRWLNSLTTENINEKAKPVEDSRKTVTAEEFIFEESGETPADADTAAAIMKEYFPDGAGMSAIMEKHTAAMDEAWVETYTLNPDGTITCLRYVPR